MTVPHPDEAEEAMVPQNKLAKILLVLGINFQLLERRQD